MKKADDLILNLSKAYPFIYEVSGRFYYIGYKTFVECTDEQIALYQEYKECFLSILESFWADFEQKKYEITHEDEITYEECKNLASIYSKIVNGQISSCGDLSELIDKCSEQEIQSLYSQYLNMQKASYLCAKVEAINGRTYNRSLKKE